MPFMRWECRCGALFAPEPGVGLNDGAAMSGMPRLDGLDAARGQ